MKPENKLLLIGIWPVCLILLLWLCGIGGVGYVVWHFVSKYW